MSAFEQVVAGLDVSFDPVTPLVAALGEHLQPVADPLFPRIGERLAVVGHAVALVCAAVTLIGDAVALVSMAVPPVRDLIALAGGVSLLVLAPLSQACPRSA